MVNGNNYRRIIIADIPKKRINDVIRLDFCIPLMKSVLIGVSLICAYLLLINIVFENLFALINIAYVSAIVVFVQAYKITKKEEKQLKVELETNEPNILYRETIDEIPTHD